MFDYLQQFNSLPQDLKDKVSSPAAMSALSEIESRYHVELAMVVMKVMIKGLAIKDLIPLLISELGLAPAQAEQAAREMKEKIFAPVADYVGLSSEFRSLNLHKDIDLLIKEAGIIIPSISLIERLQRILATYLRGVRSRIDTRETLSKGVDAGGLGLSSQEVDRVFKVCDSKKFKAEEEARSENSAVFGQAPSSRLEKIIAGSEPAFSGAAAVKNSALPTAEYDLKRALESGETKKIAAAPETTSVTAPQSLSASKEAVVAAEQGSAAEQASLTDQASPVKESSPALITIAPISAAAKPSPSAAIVRKPESSGLFKKLFSESQKTASPGAVKFAAVAGEEISATKAGQSLLPAKDSAPLDRTRQEVPIHAVRKTNIENPVSSSGAAISPAAARSRAIPATRQAEPVAGNRPRMQDVKLVPKIMGPIEELQFLDLTNFRRLGGGPEEITAKIFSKIKLLERDGYEKMIAGISAWKKSPVSRLYLKIIQEAIFKGVNAKEAAAARARTGHESLNWEEIEAIINLNSRLVF